MMDDLDFSKILQDAEALSCEIEGSTDMPRVQRNLRQVLEAGQLLVNRNARDDPGQSAETKASVFLGTKGVDITKMSKKLEPLYNVVSSAGEVPGQGGPIGGGSDADLDAFLRGERTNIIYSSVESTSKSLFNRLRENIRTDLKNAWLKDKENILNSLSGGGDGYKLMDHNFGAEYRNSVHEKRIESSSVLSKTEVTYSHEIDSYIKALVTNQPKPNILEKFEVVAGNMNDKNVQELWESVSALLSSLPAIPGSSAIEKRGSTRVRKMFILRAKQYLEKSYFAKVQNDVWKNLGGGRLGGIPSATSILKNFVSMKNMLCIPGLEVGPAECGPIWIMVYIFLRSGNIQDAITYMRDEVGDLDFASILSEYAKYESNSGSPGLPKELDAQIRLEYLRVMRMSNVDPYKKLVYCLIGACDVTNDHSEIASRLDDYLWLKLSQIRDEPPPEASHHTDFVTYASFQDLILEKYGESHFDAYKQPFTYFQALLLTGQFEAALEFLFRVSNLRAHAVHVAIVFHELGFLITSDSKSLPLIRIKSDPAGIRRLNYCHMLVQYAKSFQGSNTREALNYLYLLRSMKDQNGINLFSVCVSDMAIESKNFELLFGGISTDGCRTPGMLENMGINMRPILDYCAAESENQGMLEDAVVLYDLGGKAEAALTVLNRLLARHASRKSEEDSPRTRIQAIALILAERYQVQQPEFGNRLVLTTFFLLVDLMTFFDEFHARRTENALTIIERIRIVPLQKDEIERCVSNFHNYTDAVRGNVPDLILATMESLHVRYKKMKADGRGGLGAKAVDTEALEKLKGKAKSLVTYCGLIPYFMTGDVYSKVMQIEVQIN